MKVIPAPNKFIVQYIKPESKIGSLILPEDKQDYYRGRIIAAGSDCPSELVVGSIACYSRYGAMLLDADLGHYLIDKSELFCVEVE